MDSTTNDCTVIPDSPPRKNEKVLSSPYFECPPPIPSPPFKKLFKKPNYKGEYSQKTYNFEDLT